MRALWIAPLAAAVCAGPVAAQPESVPLELVQQLFGYREGGHAPQVVVGRIPEGLPANAFPQGARVLGGMAFGPRASSAVAAVSQAPEAAREAVRQALTAAGWTRPEQLREEVGFVSSPQPPPWYFCRGDTVMYVTVSARDAGGSYVRLNGVEARGTACRQEARSHATMLSETPIPALHAPAGVNQMGSGISTSSTGVSTSTSYRCTLTPAALVAHYAPQMQARGWTPSPPASTEGASIQPFRIRSADGKDWFGVLIASRAPGSDRCTVELQLSSPNREDGGAME